MLNLGWPEYEHEVIRLFKVDKPTQVCYMKHVFYIYVEN